MTARKRATKPAPVAVPTTPPAPPAAHVLPDVPGLVAMALPFLDHGYTIAHAGAAHVLLTRKTTPVGRLLYWLASVLVLIGPAVPGTAVVPVGLAPRVRLAQVGAAMLRYGVARKPNVYLGLDASGRAYAA